MDRLRYAIRPLAVLLLLATTAPVSAQVEVDKDLPEYTPVQAVSGNIKSVGSDTMNNEMALWADGFKAFYPNVQIEVEGKGSSTGPVALIAGTAQFAPMSRPMKAKEEDDFEKKYGYKPTPLETSIDMLAVFVHRDNPIAKTGLTLQQVDAIFSRNRKGGLNDDIRTWGDLGLTGEWADKPISISGTYGYFKDVALFGGDFKDSVKEQPGSSAVVQGIANDKYGIGYSGIGYLTADVAAVPLARDTGSRMTPATPENAYTGEYPLARFLYVYVNHRPGARLDPLRREFVRFIFSRQGQMQVLKDGYFPITAAVATDNLARVGIRR